MQPRHLPFQNTCAVEILHWYSLQKKNLPNVQAYYAVKANSNQEIIKTLFNEGASFDVASYNEFMQIYNQIKSFKKAEKDFFIWDKIIFSNTIKDKQTLQKIKRYKPLVTYDNAEEVDKIKENCETAGLVLRLKVPDTGSQVEMSSKFGAEPGDAAGREDSGAGGQGHAGAFRAECRD